jgi:leader peptidase (prepilin peptidase)/N-methyltransferase
MGLALFLFVLGAIVGSFLNVCIWRMPRHESVAYPPSHCPKCDTQLQPVDLVPLVSQVMLGARCRYCGAKISWRYFGIEFLTGCLFALIGLQMPWLGDGQWLGDPVLLLRGLIFMATLVVIFWIDYDVRLIQMEAVLLLGIAGVGADLWQVSRQQALLTTGRMFDSFDLLPAPLPSSILAMVFTATLLWLMRELFSRLYGREAMGFGDVLLVAAIAANLGWNATIVTFFFLAFVAGAPLAIGLQIPSAIRAFRWGKARQRKYGAPAALARALARRSFRRSIPFGPMLAIAAVLALLYGPRLNEAYLRLLS